MKNFNLINERIKRLQLIKAVLNQAAINLQLALMLIGELKGDKVLYDNPHMLTQEERSVLISIGGIDLLEHYTKMSAENITAIQKFWDSNHE